MVVTILLSRHDLAAIDEESTTNEVNSTELLPETVPRFPTTGNTAQVSTTDRHYYSSITEPGTGKASTAGRSVEEVSSAITNACTLLTSSYWYLLCLPSCTVRLCSHMITLCPSMQRP